MFQEERVRQAIAQLLEAVGEDPSREGLRETPGRVAEMYRELLSGLTEDPKEVLKTGFQAGYEDVVLVRDIAFYSLCEHHLLPFFGKAHIGYIPNGWVVGASKLVRALEVLAHRPQMQERLTKELADTLQEALKPDGVAVVLSAEHLCMTMRGVKKPGSLLVTMATRGAFGKFGRNPTQLLTLLQQQGKAL